MHRPCRIRGRVCCSFAMCAVYWRQQYRKGAAAMRESATKKVLAESLKELMLRRDFADITVTDLCAAAEINRRTFYRHFTDKYQLVTWIYDKGFQKAIGDDEPGLYDLFGRVCTYLYADRAFYARALTFTGQNSFHDFLCARLRPYLQADFSDLFSDPQNEAFMSGKMSDVGHGYYSKLAQPAGLPAAGGVCALGAAPVEGYHGPVEGARRCVGAHIRPQKRISEAKSHETAVPWLSLWRNLFYAEHTPSFGSGQAQRALFDLSRYLFSRCATVSARFRSRSFGRACLPFI